MSIYINIFPEIKSAFMLTLRSRYIKSFITPSDEIQMKVQAYYYIKVIMRLSRMHCRMHPLNYRHTNYSGTFGRLLNQSFFEGLGFLGSFKRDKRDLSTNVPRNCRAKKVPSTWFYGDVWLSRCKLFQFVTFAY
uniref:Uncharacterized protein n=1 Tax=Rhizophagus irregularis (strain DAOM 181602 / DAOM 197198 / MUCL 43194) TaxID=747089 RepID=U9TP60_RHIID